MTGRVQERINLRDGHTLVTGSNLHDLVAGFDLSLLDDAKIEAGSAMRHSTGEPLQTSAPPVFTKSVQAGSCGATAERRGTGVRWPHRSVFPPNKDTSISFIYECRRVSGEIVGPSRQIPPFPDTPVLPVLSGRDQVFSTPLVGDFAAYRDQRHHKTTLELWRGRGATPRITPSPRSPWAGPRGR